MPLCLNVANLKHSWQAYKMSHVCISNQALCSWLHSRYLDIGRVAHANVLTCPILSVSLHGLVNNIRVIMPVQRARHSWATTSPLHSPSQQATENYPCISDPATAAPRLWAGGHNCISNTADSSC